MKYFTTLRLYFRNQKEYNDYQMELNKTKLKKTNKSKTIVEVLTRALEKYNEEDK